MEALVGSLKEESVGAGTPEEPQTDGSMILDGLLRLAEWEETTGLPLPEDDKSRAETLGGLVMSRLGRMPMKGDEVLVSDHKLRVEELDGRRVATLRLLPPAAGVTEP